MAVHQHLLTGVFFIGFLCHGVSGQLPQTVFFDTDLPVPENTEVDGNRNYTGMYTSNTVNTTIIMTYNDIAYYWYSVDPYTKNYNMGYEGFVSCFRFYARYAEPIKISIWRWEVMYLDMFGTVYMNDTMVNGQYTLVGITDTLYPEVGENHHCVNEGWRVLPNDFLGITYGRRNPIPYDFDNGCQNVFNNILQTCPHTGCTSETPDWDSFNGWQSYHEYHEFHPGSTYWFSHHRPDCQKYSLQAYLLEEPDYSLCQAIQLTNDYQMYELTSHLEYDGYSHYPDLLDSCWVLRAADENSIIHFELVTFEVEPAGNCIYDSFSIETDYGSSGKYCGSYSNMKTFYLTGSATASVLFSTDGSVTEAGYLFRIRSVYLSDSDNYWNQGGTDSYQWPWEDSSVFVTVTDDPEAGASTGDDDGMSLAVKIGIGIGGSIAFLILMAILCGCCYMCCSQQTNNKKVQPHGAHPVKQNRAYGNNQPAYPKQTYAPKQQTGVFMTPQQPQGPSNRALPPLGTNMPQYPRMPPQQPNGRPQGTSPYPVQKYIQTPQETIPEPTAPSTMPPRPQQPKQPHTQPKHSLSSIAFALRQPKPLKSVIEPFGGAKPQQPKKSEEEMMALGRARLNWGVAVIPGPATYIEPQQWREGQRGQAPPPPFPPAVSQHQYSQIAENDVSYHID